MKNKLYNLKSKYVICITLILVLGLIGSSYAMWSDTHLIINELNTGFLQANIETEIPDNEYVIITEKLIIYEDNDDQDDQGDEDKDKDKDNDEDDQCNDDKDKDDDQECKKEYYCNYNIIPFTIVNKGTVPLKLEEYGISLNSTDISHICTIVFDDFVIIDEYKGYIQIDNNKLEELSGLINNENNNIILILCFKQTNLFNGGWTQEENILIPILKNTERIIIDDEQDDNNQDNQQIK